jgi:hypothetical protein
MKTPGFNAEASLYKTSGRYQATMYDSAPTTGIVAQYSLRAVRGTCPSFQECISAFLGCYPTGGDPPSLSACVTHNRCVRCGIEVW